MEYKEELVPHYEGIVNTLKDIGYNNKYDLKNFEGTPKRCAKALNDLIWTPKKINEELNKSIVKDFPMPGDPGIVCTDCVVIGMCPHHLLPVFHQIYVGYLPLNNHTIIGTSKLIRIVDALAKRPILQEQLALDITATLYNGKYEDDEDINFSNMDEEELMEFAEDNNIDYDMGLDEDSLRIYLKKEWVLNKEEIEETGFNHFKTSGSFCIMGSLHSCMATRGVKSFSLVRESSMRGIFIHDRRVSNEAYEQIRLFPSNNFIFN